MPRSTSLPHPVGIVIGDGVEIGENVKIRQNVTLGTREGAHPSEYPTIQDNVTIHAGAMVLGDVTIGEGAVIGANSVVLEDVESDSTVVGTPATEVDQD